MCGSVGGPRVSPRADPVAPEVAPSGSLSDLGTGSRGSDLWPGVALPLPRVGGCVAPVPVVVVARGVVGSVIPGGVAVRAWRVFVVPGGGVGPRGVVVGAGRRVVVARRVIVGAGAPVRPGRVVVTGRVVIGVARV